MPRDLTSLLKATLFVPWLSGVAAVALAGFRDDPYLEHVAGVPAPHAYDTSTLFWLTTFITIQVTLLTAILRLVSYRHSWGRALSALLASFGFLLAVSCSPNMPPARTSASATPSEPAALDYEQSIHLDAEALAEMGIAEQYNALLPQLRRYVPSPAPIEELIDPDAPRYSVRCGQREFLIFEPGKEDESWGRATFAFFTLVNDQLAQSEYRFYALNGGNDLFGIFLTEAEAKTAQQAISTKRDWPYLPDDRAPWYGQHH